MDDDLLELFIMWLMLFVMIRRRRRSDRWRNRRWYVRPINQNRRLQGDYYHLLQELKEDESMFFRYLRMDLETFTELLELIHPHLARVHSRALNSELRLALTLRYSVPTMYCPRILHRKLCELLYITDFTLYPRKIANRVEAPFLATPPFLVNS